MDLVTLQPHVFVAAWRTFASPYRWKRVIGGGWRGSAIGVVALIVEGFLSKK